MKIPHDRWPRVLALAAHELRTPAGVVSGYTRMLLRGQAGDLAEAQRAMLEAADRSNSRLAELLGQMSELAHLEDGTTRLDPHLIDLASALSPPADSEGPDPSVLLPVPVARLRADAPRLKRALAAIAALHRRTGARAVAVAARADVATVWGAFGGGDRVRDAVAADERLEPFDDLHGGLGLELILARAVIERHEGAVGTRPGPSPDREVTVIRLPRAEEA